MKSWSDAKKKKKSVPSTQFSVKSIDSDCPKSADCLWLSAISFNSSRQQIWAKVVWCIPAFTYTNSFHVHK